MSSYRDTERWRDGLSSDDAWYVQDALHALGEGMCDDVAVIPVLEGLAKRDLWYYDDNGAGGLPRATNGPVSFALHARAAIEDIRENCSLQSSSPLAPDLKSYDGQRIRGALQQLTGGNSTDETLVPILEKIARKNPFSSYDRPGNQLGDLARCAIVRIRQSMREAGIAGTACERCGSIFDFASANTPLDANSAAPIATLKRHQLDGERDLLECARCGALFHWTREGELGRSGYEPTLGRFRKEDAHALREIVRRANRPVGDVAAFAERFRALQNPAFALAALHLLARDRDLARALVSPLAEWAAKGESWAAEFLKRLASTPEDAVFVARALPAPTGSSPLEALRARARVAGCSICSSLEPDSLPALRRDALPPNLGKLKRLGASEQNDAWECPECDSMFHWTSEDGLTGGLTRVAGGIAEALRTCIRGSALDERAVETVFASGREWQQLLLEYGTRHDHQLLMHLVPRLVSELARNEHPWVHDALCEIALDPYGASAVRAAAADIRLPNSLIQSLQARAASP